MKVLVTGGAGFIGSCFTRLMLRTRPDLEVAVADKLTYAGNLENLVEVESNPRYRFARVDITDAGAINQLVDEFQPDAIVHFAAESHVDRSILAPTPVFETNLRGTFVLLEAARAHKIKRFVHVSTDEVYGSIPEPYEADETFPLNASSPYSASKAGSDLLALSYVKTYKLPVLVTRASNNYGPFQFPEKLIPLMISNAFEDKQLPVYGDGMQVRDWLYVEDHCRAIASVLEKGLEGEIYNIGGTYSLPNIEVVQRILALTGKSESLIRYVTDRPGHDVRYALSSEKLMKQTGWKAERDFVEGLQSTIDWYRQNTQWIQNVKSGEYQKYYKSNYSNRGTAPLTA